MPYTPQALDRTNKSTLFVMLVFVFIWVLLVGDSRRKVCTVQYLLLGGANFQFSRLSQAQNSGFQHIHGNLGVRAMPLEFVFRIICLA